jgi:hypothetical protein
MEGGRSIGRPLAFGCCRYFNADHKLKIIATAIVGGAPFTSALAKPLVILDSAPSARRGNISAIRGFQSWRAFPETLRNDMQKLALLLSAIALPVTVMAQQRDAASAPSSVTPAPPPKLIVAISVDQFSGDLFAEYRQYYTGGLRRLTQGAVFPRGYQSHAATETCPGHSTILTGSHPARTGIVANSWYDPGAPRADKMVYCVEDERQPGTDSKNYVVSPVHLRVPTLGGRMKRADPRVRVVSVAGKDRAAVMLGGPTADQSWWLTPEGYKSYRGVAVPPPIARINSDLLAQIAKGHAAMPLPTHCTAKDFEVAVGGGKVVGTGRFERAGGRYQTFRASPEQDRYTLRLATNFVEEMQLGKGSQTDIISIGLSANDYIGHAFGTSGTEMCIQQFALDQALGDFFDRLDRDGIDYVVVLTADHGGHDLPERHRMNAMPMEQRVDSALTSKLLSAAVAANTGIAGKLIVGDSPQGDLYFAAALTAAERAEGSAATLAILRAHPQVQTVFTKAEISAEPSPSGPPESWTLLQEVRASFDPERSGDLFVILKPRTMAIADPVKGAVATHGSPWDTDRRVPILFWRKGMRAFEQPLGVETVDILPSSRRRSGWLFHRPKSTADVSTCSPVRRRAARKNAAASRRMQRRWSANTVFPWIGDENETPGRERPGVSRRNQPVCCCASISSSDLPSLRGAQSQPMTPEIMRKPVRIHARFVKPVA